MSAFKTFYFSHDANARNDPRMLMLRAKHGPVAYAAYFMLVEMLREQSDFKIKDCPEMIPALAITTGVQAEALAKIIEDSISSGLLVRRRGFLYSDSLLRRMGVMTDISRRRAEAGRLGGLAKAERSSNCQPNDKQMLSTPLALNKRKEKESNNGLADGGKPRFTPPRIDEVKSYCAERSNGVNPEKWMAHYEANGWKVGRNPMRDWKAAVRTWEQGGTSNGTAGISPNLVAHD